MKPDSSQHRLRKTRIVVFQQHGSGKEKITGIKRFGDNLEITNIYEIDAELPELIDTPDEYFPENFSGDLVLCFLKHPDLIEHLVSICTAKKIPIIAAGKKVQGAISPFTCCGLGYHEKLGSYGEQFGFPEFSIELDGEIISKIDILRGASCGATWEAAKKIIGLTAEEAMTTLAREVQYICHADPSAFDPISGKSAVHYAGHVHNAALKKAIEKK